MNNLYPLWYLIDREAQHLLVKYQQDNYGTKIEIPQKPMTEIPIDYAKEMKKKPHNPVKVK